MLYNFVLTLCRLNIELSSTEQAAITYSTTTDHRPINRPKNVAGAVHEPSAAPVHTSMISLLFLYYISIITITEKYKMLQIIIAINSLLSTQEWLIGSKY